MIVEESQVAQEAKTASKVMNSPTEDKEKEAASNNGAAVDTLEPGAKEPTVEGTAAYLPVRHNLRLTPGFPSLVTTFSSTSNVVQLCLHILYVIIIRVSSILAYACYMNVNITQTRTFTQTYTNIL